MKIVIGGSRHLEFIPSSILERLDEWMQTSTEFLVGDAPGSDRAFQSILKTRGYPSVTVYTSAEFTRNNLGEWPVVKVDSGLRSKSNAVHAFKDREMCKQADLGLMVWDCESSGTLSNLIDLVEQEKNCFIWVAPDSELYQFDNLGSLDKWMSAYPATRDEALKRLATFRKRALKKVIDESQPGLFG
jgi:hypothetical protein